MRPLIHHIIDVWRAGYDTLEIATLLKITEGEVYNIVAQRPRRNAS